jgi:hypothetical protein
MGGRTEHRREEVRGVLHGLDGRLRARRRRELQDELESRFRPMRPASLPRLILAAIFGPLAWLACVLLAVALVQPGHQVLLGALVAAAAFLFGVIVLLLLRRGRTREERDCVDSA